MGEFMEYAYLVTGRTGEYDICREWHVSVFMDETICLDFVDALNKLLRENGISDIDKLWKDSGNPIPCPPQYFFDTLNEIDPQLEKNWINFPVSYSTEKIPIYD